MWQCATGRRGGRDVPAMLAALETTAGVALVRPAHHAALSGCGFTVRGGDSHLALRCAWDDYGTMRFEWVGARLPLAERSPQRPAWDMTLTANGVTVWRTADATGPAAAASLKAAIGAEGVECPWPTLVVVRWAGRADGRSVSVTLGAAGGQPLYVSIAPLF